MWPVDRKPKDARLIVCSPLCICISTICSLIEGRAGILKFSECILTLLTDCCCLSSPLLLTVTELAMAGHRLPDDHVRALLREVSHNKLKKVYQNLHFHGNNWN